MPLFWSVKGFLANFEFSNVKMVRQYFKQFGDRLTEHFRANTGFFFKWVIICLPVGILCGSASAVFLLSLEYVTGLRENHSWLIWLLPAGGLVSGVLYHYYGRTSEKGNALIFAEINQPQKQVPLIMAPLVYLGTVITHLFGGSAGREGTAVQMAGAISDKVARLLRLDPEDRRLLLTAGVSAGFASVFGTPLAGAIFALEVSFLKRFRYEAIFPSFIAAVIADYTCRFWQVGHTGYSIPLVPSLTPVLWLWAVFAGLAFGLCAFVFIHSTDYLKDTFKKYISYPPLRLVAGGLVVALLLQITGAATFAGLGVPVISSAFYLELPPADFLIKLILTAITLGAGFKGGEVTPLFFIGAVLGNALAYFVPLPLALLAGMGFVAVFCGATNTPVASTVLGMELFGTECCVFVGTACLIAYLFSGASTIYARVPPENTGASL